MKTPFFSLLAFLCTLVAFASAISHHAAPVHINSPLTSTVDDDNYYQPQIQQQVNKQQPGVRALVTPRGRAWAAQTGIPLLLAQLRNMNIPDISKTVSTPIGNLDISIQKIKLSGVQLGGAKFCKP